VAISLHDPAASAEKCRKPKLQIKLKIQRAVCQNQQRVEAFSPASCQLNFDSGFWSMPAPKLMQCTQCQMSCAPRCPAVAYLMSASCCRWKYCQGVSSKVNFWPSSLVSGQRSPELYESTALLPHLACGCGTHCVCVQPLSCKRAGKPLWPGSARIVGGLRGGWGGASAVCHRKMSLIGNECVQLSLLPHGA